MTDYYRALGLTKGASQEDIKRAYRKLAMQHHPDRGGDVSKFQEIEEAYRVLGDEKSRAQYDSKKNGHSDFSGLFQENHFGGGQWTDISDIFENFVRTNSARQRAQRKNRDLRISIDIPLPELLKPQKKIVKYTTSKNENSVIEIDIPVGVEEGTTIRYPNLGDNFFDSLPRGDLYVTIRHTNNDGFIKLNRSDVQVEAEIDCWDAMTGTQVTVRSLDGTEFLVKIPPGTQNGTKFNLKGQGLFTNVKDGIRGNLLVLLKIKIPIFSESDRIRIAEFKKNLTTGKDNA